MGWLRIKNPIQVYTDGCCLHNPGGMGGWAAIIFHEGVMEAISGAEESTTNNRMELRAAIEALKKLPPGSDAYVYTDSQYVKNGMCGWVHKWKANGWKTGKTGGGDAVLNQDLWEELYDLATHHVISWIWVRGHDGNFYNELCDEMASEAAINCNKQLDKSPA